MVLCLWSFFYLYKQTLRKARALMEDAQKAPLANEALLAYLST